VVSGAKPQPPTILVHFENLETLRMTSKMCMFYAHDLSFKVHPCLIRAHMIFIYFVSPKKLPHPFRRSPSAGARGHIYAPLPYARRHCINQTNSFYRRLNCHIVVVQLAEKSTPAVQQPQSIDRRRVGCASDFGYQTKSARTDNCSQFGNRGGAARCRAERAQSCNFLLL